MRTFALSLFALLSLGMSVASARADTLYCYTGDKFTFVQGIYDPGNQVTGSFILSSLFIPSPPFTNDFNVSAFVLSYSFTDGHQTLTQSNSTAVFEIGFAADGTPIVPTYPGGSNASWYVDIKGPNGEILTENINLTGWQTYAATGSSYASILSINGSLYPGGPGTWTLYAVPEPTTLVFLGIGIALLAAFKPTNLGARQP